MFDTIKYRLSDIIEIIGGGTPKRKVVEYWCGDIPWLSVVDFNSGSRFVNDTVEKITKIGLEMSSAKVIEAGQIIISARGTVGCLAQLSRPMAFNQSCYGLTGKDGIIKNDFLYYLMRFKVEELKRKAHGAVFDTITRETFNHIDVEIPSIPIQIEIAKILGDLDRKMELNCQTNQTLEQISRALFKSWFVDFDPVKAKIHAKQNNQDPELVAMQVISGKNKQQFELWLKNEAKEDEIKQLTATAALFPGELVESELGEIPKGWRVKPLDKVAYYQNGLALQKFRPEDENYFLPVVKIAQLKKGNADGAEKASPNIKEECILDNGDVVFSWSGSLMVDVWCGGKAALNQHLFKVTSIHYPKWFYYYWTKHHLKFFQQIASDKAVTMGHIKRSHLTEALCVIPTEELLNNKTIESLLYKQIETRLESKTLEKVRDSLLPKLLLGEIKINKNKEIA